MMHPYIQEQRNRRIAATVKRNWAAKTPEERKAAMARLNEAKKRKQEAAI